MTCATSIERGAPSAVNNDTIVHACAYVHVYAYRHTCPIVKRAYCNHDREIGHLNGILHAQVNWRPVRITNMRDGEMMIQSWMRKGQSSSSIATKYWDGGTGGHASLLGRRRHRSTTAHHWWGRHHAARNTDTDTCMRTHPINPGGSHHGSVEVAGVALRRHGHTYP